MNLDHLAIFIDLAETLNFRKTAERKNISQPAVSQCLNSVEREVGTKLIDRSRKGARLTESGMVFYKNMKPLINSYYKGIQEARLKASGDASSLTIGSTGTPYEQQFLPKLIREFHRIHPKVKIFMQNYDHNLLKRQLLSHECDVIWATLDDFKDIDSVKYVQLMKGSFVAQVPTLNSLAKRKQLKVTDFNYNNVILMDNNWCPPEQYKLQEKIRKANSGLNISYVNNVSVADLMVKSALGISVMPSFIAGKETSDSKIVPIDYVADLNYGLVYLKENKSESVRKFSRFCRDYFEE